MALASQSGPSRTLLREGSHVTVVEQDDVSAQTNSASTGTLHLRGGPRDRPRVVWDEDVVDNEGLGRKKSKSACNRTDETDRERLTLFLVCCIYHKPRQFDESSDENTSGTESSGSDSADARPSREYRHRHRHAHDGECEADPHKERDDKRRDGSDDRNAYEQIPGKGKSTS